MAYANCKIYSDGSHFIAIPHTVRPRRPRKKPREDLVTVPVGQAADAPPDLSAERGAVSKSAGAESSPKTGSIPETEPASFPGSEAKRSARKVTCRDFFEEWYPKSLELPRRARQKWLTERMRPCFGSEEQAEEFVRLQLERKRRNLLSRRIRCLRKANLHDFNYFVTFTYDDKLHTEQSFRQKLRICLRNLCSRKGWRYMGVWERSPEKHRLHFHGIFFIPEGSMPGSMIRKNDYSFHSRRRQITCQNTYFNDRFGRSDFEPLAPDTLPDAIGYILKYIEKTEEKIVCSRGLPPFFRSDVMDEDVVCPMGLEDKKLLLFDDFRCWDQGVLVGRVGRETISQMPKAN